jgi:hypothetical protein
MQAMIANQPVVIVLLDSWGRLTRIGDANRIRKWLEKNRASSSAVDWSRPSPDDRAAHQIRVRRFLLVHWFLHASASRPIPIRINRLSLRVIQLA